VTRSRWLQQLQAGLCCQTLEDGGAHAEGERRRTARAARERGRWCRCRQLWQDFSRLRGETVVVMEVESDLGEAEQGLAMGRGLHQHQPRMPSVHMLPGELCYTSCELSSPSAWLRETPPPVMDAPSATDDSLSASPSPKSKPPDQSRPRRAARHSCRHEKPSRRACSCSCSCSCLSAPVSCNPPLQCAGEGDTDRGILALPALLSAWRVTTGRALVVSTSTFNVMPRDCCRRPQLPRQQPWRCVTGTMKSNAPTINQKRPRYDADYHITPPYVFPAVFLAPYLHTRPHLGSLLAFPGREQKATPAIPSVPAQTQRRLVRPSGAGPLWRAHQQSVEARRPESQYRRCLSSYWLAYAQAAWVGGYLSARPP
jgi:hypothetical protein